MNNFMFPTAPTEPPRDLDKEAEEILKTIPKEIAQVLCSVSEWNSESCKRIPWIAEDSGVEEKRCREVLKILLKNDLVHYFRCHRFDSNLVSGSGYNRTRLGDIVMHRYQFGSHHEDHHILRN